MSHTRYLHTRASGVEWLGDVPTHWAVKRLKFSVRDARNGVWGDDPTGEGDIRCVRVADFDRPHLLVGSDKATYRSVAPADLANRGLSKGDLLLEKSGGGEKSPVGFVVRYDLDEPAVCSNFVARVRLAPGMDSRFWTYAHHSNYQKQLTQRSIKQTSGIQNLDQQSYLDELVAFPDAIEQRAIADFLDRETAQIDELIGKQNALIDLLGERRKAVITQAVTKGLDPHAPMKDSGVEWLGSIPSAWETRRLKYIAQAIIGLTYDPSDVVEADAGGTLVLRSGNVQDGVVSLADCVYVTTRIPSDLRVRSGDILVCSRNGSRALVGKSAVLGPDLVGATFGAFMTVVRSKESDYLSWVLKSSLFQYQLGSFSTSTINQLTVGTLNNFELPVPPVELQERIAAYLQRATGRLDQLLQKAEATVRVLQERRSVLITAAVTGKIDVRELVS